MRLPGRERKEERKEQRKCAFRGERGNKKNLFVQNGESNL